jgi:hypothetical protein
MDDCRRISPSHLDWSAERIATMRLLVDEGKTASQIALYMGGVTKNAVIGKCNRLGLKIGAKRRADLAAQRQAERIERDRLAAERKAFEAIKSDDDDDLFEDEEEDAPLESGVLFMETQALHCRWIEGEVARRTVCCGELVVPNSSYCPANKARAFIRPRSWS